MHIGPIANPLLLQRNHVTKPTTMSIRLINELSALRKGNLICFYLLWDKSISSKGQNTHFFGQAVVNYTVIIIVMDMVTAVTSEFAESIDFFAFSVKISAL